MINYDVFINESERLLLHEAQEVNSDDDNLPEEEAPDENKIQSLAMAFSRGELSQEEIVKMYQAGAISREEIDQVLKGPQVPEPEPEPTSEEILRSQVSQINDTFIRFSLYDKINALEARLDIFEENFNDITSSLYKEIVHIREFLKIMSSLIFTLEVNTLYHMYGNIELKLIQQFESYKLEQQQQEISKKIKGEINADN